MPFTLWYSMKAKFEKEKFTEGTVQDNVDQWVKEAKVEKDKCDYCFVNGDTECLEECECGDCLDNHEQDCTCEGCCERGIEHLEAMRDAYD